MDSNAEIRVHLYFTIFLRYCFAALNLHFLYSFISINVCCRELGLETLLLDPLKQTLIVQV